LDPGSPSMFLKGQYLKMVFERKNQIFFNMYYYLLGYARF
jgi:hypothetical protein